MAVKLHCAGCCACVPGIWRRPAFALLTFYWLFIFLLCLAVRC